MGRSLKKGPYVDLKLLKKIEKAMLIKKKQVIKTFKKRFKIVLFYLFFICLQ